MNKIPELKTLIEYAIKESRKLSEKKSNKNIRLLPLKKNCKMAIAWSGGKDSCLMLHKAIKEGFGIAFLFNLIFKEKGICATPPYNPDLIVLQSRALNIPLKQVDISDNPRKKFKEFIKSIKRQGVDAIGLSYTGATDQRNFVHAIAFEEGIGVFEPICSVNKKALLLEVIENQIKAVVVGVERGRLDKRCLGKTINRRFFSYITKQKNVDFCGEGGHFQTFVFDNLLFKKAISLKDVSFIETEHHYHLYIKEGRLVNKS